METEISSKNKFLSLSLFSLFFVVWIISIVNIIYSYFLYTKISNISYEDLIKSKLLDGSVVGAWTVARDNGKLNLLLADSYAERGNYSLEENSDKKNRPNKDLSIAVEFYKKAIISNPLSGESHLKLGILYANLKMNREASSELKKAALLDSRNAYQLFDVGRYFFKIKSYKEGSRILKEANTIRPQFLPESLNIAWNSTGDYRVLIDVTPERQYTFLTLGNFLLEKEMLERAVEAYKKAISLDPKQPLLYKYLSSVYEIRGSFDEALKVMDNGIKVLPKHPDMYFYLGWIYFLKNQSNEAIFNIEKAINLSNGKSDNKNLIEYHQMLGEIYLNKTKDYEKALAEANEILKLNPIEARAYFLKGLCYKSINSNPDKMIDCFKKAVIYSPQDLKYRFTLAENYYLYGLYKEALAEWEEIRKLNPQEELVEKKIREIKEAMKKDRRSMIDKYSIENKK